MIIEDEDELLELMRIRLESAGYAVETALNGEVGLKKALEKKFDLVLLDIVMPVMDGYTVCRRLKTDGTTKDVPIIIVAATGGRELPQKSFEAGADDFIFKPFEARELLERIEKRLGSKAG